MSGRRFARWPDLFRSPVGIAAALMVGGFLLLAVIAPPIWSHAASKIDVLAASQGSSAAHPLGTDLLGRDILHRVLVATRLSVLLAVMASLLGAAIGVPLGVLPALLGRRLGRLITAAINLAVAFPTLLLAIFVASIVGTGSPGRGDRDRGGSGAVLRTAQPDARGLGGRRRLHRGGSRARHRAAEADEPACPAECGGAAVADADADDGRRTPRTGRAQLSGARSAAALLRLGRHAHRGSRPDLRHADRRRGAGGGDHPRRARVQPARRDARQEGGEARRDAPAAIAGGAARRSGTRTSASAVEEPADGGQGDGAGRARASPCRSPAARFRFATSRSRSSPARSWASSASRARARA